MANDTKKKDDEISAQAEETINEMRAAMATMTESGLRMMQSFLDMRMSYLKVMRSSLDDPQSTMAMMPQAGFAMLQESIDDVTKSVEKQAKMLKDQARK